MLNHINFPKVVTVLAIIFGVSLGLCGLTAVASSSFRSGGGGLIFAAAWIEVFAIGGSFVALACTLLLWILSALFGRTTEADPGFQRLFDDDRKGGDE